MQTVKGVLSLSYFSVKLAPLPQIQAALHTAEPGLSGASIQANWYSQHHGTHNDYNQNEPLTLLQLIDVTSCHKHDALVFARLVILQGHALYLVIGSRSLKE